MRSMEKPPYTMRVPRKSDPEYYLDQVLPILLRRRVRPLIMIECLKFRNYFTRRCFDYVNDCRDETPSSWLMSVWTIPLWVQLWWWLTFGIFCRFYNWQSLTIDLQMTLMMSYKNYVAVLIIMLWDLQNLYENLVKDLPWKCERWKTDI